MGKAKETTVEKKKQVVPGERFGLKGMDIVDTIELEDRFVIIAESSLKAKICPTCGGKKFWKHSSTKTVLAHTPLNGTPCTVELSRNRYECLQCGHVISAAMPECVDPQHKYTKPLVKVLSKLVLVRKLADLEKDYGISDTSLGRFTDDLIDRLDSTGHIPLPYKLGLDEVKIQGKFRTTITNLERHTIIDILESRDLKTVKAYFLDNYTLEERKKVGWVSTDMWRAFMKPLEEVFPNATWVIDRFHVQALANNALDSIRKAMQAANPGAELSLRLKKNLRWTLLRRFADLTDESKLDLESIKLGMPKLYTAYALKESFGDIYEIGVRADAEEAYANWVKSIPDDPMYDAFRGVAKTVSKASHYNQIFNYWDSNKLTNAFTECANSLIRSVDRSGRGYSFRVLRARMLYNEDAIEAAALHGNIFGASIDSLIHTYPPIHVDKDMLGNAVHTNYIPTDMSTIDFSSFSAQLEALEAEEENEEDEEDVPF